MANRTTKIAGRVRATLGALSNQELTDTVIYNTMDDIQRRICEDALCNEASMNLSVTADGDTYDLSTSGGTLITNAQYGTVNSLTEALVNSTNTTLTFDKAFTQTYTDLNGDTVPAYRFVIQDARVGTSTTQEEVTIITQSLDSIVLKSSSDSTLVRFICLSVASSVESPAGASTSGFFRLKYIELPSGFSRQLEEISPIMRDSLERWPQTPTIQYPVAYSIFDEILTFYPAPTAAGTYIIHFYKIPTTNLGASVEPEITSTFDTALYYGAVAELAPAVKGSLFEPYQQLYRAEMQRVVGTHRTRKSYIGQIQYQDF